MAKYSDIKGFTVQTLSTDTVASQAAGGSWSSGGDLNTARSYLVGMGISTAALAAGGYTGSYTGKTESYNGTSWTETTDLNTTRAIGAGAGTYTAAIYFGGGTDPTNYDNTESWNGSTWTEVNDLNESKTSMMGSGTSTAAICAGGSPNKVNTEIWDGTNWTEVNNIPSVLLATTGGGSSTSAIIATGQTNPPDSGVQSTADSWDGTNWTEISPVNTARYQAGGTGFQPGSSNTDVMIFGGGTTPVTGKTEFWDGSSWTEIGDMSTARGQQAASNGTSSDAIVAGGIAPGYSAATEEWTAPSTFTKQVQGQLYFNSTTNTFKETLNDAAAGAWASITSGNTARRVASGVGPSVSVGMVIAGYPQEDEVETWNGSSWTEVAEVNTARGSSGASANSPSSTALFFGGDARPGGAARVANNESWNGSAWTETGDLPADVQGNAGAGVSSTSAISFGGFVPAKSGATYDWDGSSWTTGGTMATARGYVSGVGTATAALALGGFRTSPSSAVLTSAESYNGSSWTNLSDTNSGHSFGGAAGTTTSAMLFGGEGPGYPGGAMTQSENWNGTAWTEVADISTGNNSPAGFGGSGTSCISSFGNSPGSLLATAEEFSAGLANKTITAS
jgi:hypothetical protein